jgi:hypothetical protein
MNRRSFIQAAALLPAVASQTRGMVSASHPPVLAHPVEVDLADAEAAWHIGNSGTDLFVLLEEGYAGDPGQLSGISLRISGSGRFTTLTAEGASPQRDGSQLSHCWGYLQGAELALVGADSKDAEAGFSIRLRELYPEVKPDSYSGAHLALCAGENPELQVCFGTHCMGVLRARLLTRFLKCVRQRCEAEAA